MHLNQSQQAILAAEDTGNFLVNEKARKYNVSPRLIEYAQDVYYNCHPLIVKRVKEGTMSINLARRIGLSTSMKEQEFLSQCFKWEALSWLKNSGIK